MIARRPAPARYSRIAVFPVNVPNVLTVLRILLVPVLVVALLDETPNGDLLAAIVFAVASLTDAVDGWLARRRQWVTTFGKLMDPVADKLLVIGALLTLVSLDRLDAWVAMVIIAREFAVTALRMAATSYSVIVPANTFGKAKTVMQVAMVFALIVVPDAGAWLDALVYATVAVTVASGIDYAFGIRRQVNRARLARRVEPGA
jgi:CDP-diacylglycerol---glycerol-3-phosphate 3-phosphatidyltransferase